MKTRTLVVMLFILTSPYVLAQNSSQGPAAGEKAGPQPTGQAGSTPAAPGDQPKIDPAKEANIRLLINLVGTKSIIVQMMNTMMINLKPAMEKSFPPGEYREKLVDLFLEKFRSKVDAQQVLDLAIPFYDKYYSNDEIKGLINFYQSPLGQKYISVLPKLFTELQAEGGKWGEKLGRESLLEVLSEHPELQKALEEAKKAETSH